MLLPVMILVRFPSETRSLGNVSANLAFMFYIVVPLHSISICINGIFDIAPAVCLLDKTLQVPLPLSPVTHSCHLQGKVWIGPWG